MTDSVSEIAVSPSADLQPLVATNHVPSRVATSVDRLELRATPWWLWWNILSLDAPVVAVVWAFLFARAGHMSLSTVDVVALALAVWGIYAGDRVLDGWMAKSGAALRERHVFGARHGILLIGLVVLAAASGFWMTARQLAPGEAIAGLKLGAIVCGYLAAVHIGAEWITRFVPKEVFVGLLFTAGTALPTWSQKAVLPWNFWISLAMFAVLCFLNCTLIERWENDSSENARPEMRHPTAAQTTSRLNWTAAGLAAASALVALVVVRSKGSFASELFAISLTALLLFLLNRNRHRLSVPGLRVLADAALAIAGLIGLMARIW